MEMLIKLMVFLVSLSAFSKDICLSEEFFLSGMHPTVDALLNAKYIDVLVVEATVENTRGFGRIIDDFDDAKVKIISWPSNGRRPVLKGDEGGIVQGKFIMQWQNDKSCRAVNEAVHGNYITGARDDHSIYVHEANYHPDGEQIVFAIEEKPYILLLARSNLTHADNIKPEDFVAFRFKGDKGFAIAPGVWHQPAFPLIEGLEFRNKQGAVHACVPVNFMKEFGVVVRIPNVF